MRAVKVAKRARTVTAGAGIKKNKASFNHAKAPPRPSASHNTAPVAYVLAEDADALDCSICFLPLKAPIFQCDVGHAVCSPCHDMLKGTGKCHICGVTTHSFRRCHTMERVMEAIRAPCQNAAYGCTARPAYHDLEGHIQKCLHGPCCCPDKDCSFVGSTEALLGHFSGVHGWLCTNTMADGRFKARLKNGFNFLHADHCASTPGLLFVLKVIRSPLVGCAISVLRIRPNAATNGQGPSSTECELVYSRYVTARSRRGGDQLTDHYQRCKFRVACTNGLPSPGECFQLLVPDFALGEENKETIKVDGRIFTGYIIRVSLVDLVVNL